MVAEDLGVPSGLPRKSSLKDTTIGLRSIWSPSRNRCHLALNRGDLLPCLLVELKLFVVEHIWIQELLEFSDGSIVLLALLPAELPDQVRLVVVFTSGLFTGRRLLRNPHIGGRLRFGS